MSWDVWIALIGLFGVGGLMPGPAVMYVVTSAFRYGFRPAVTAAFGIAAANIVWLLLAAFGAAALAASFPAVFLGLKILGMFVILYLAGQAIFGPLPSLSGGPEAIPKARLFSRAVALQLTSPMPLIWFGLLLPTYFDPQGSFTLQILIMLITVTLTELLGLSLYAYGAQTIRQWLSHPKYARLFGVFIGLIMVASGVLAMTSTTS